MVNFNRNTHPTGAGREHIPHQPFWLAIIRVIQGIFNILVLSLAANAASYVYLSGYGMAFFTFVWTVLFLLYTFCAPRFMPQAYHFWGHFVFEALTTIFWLTTFALLADYTRAWSDTWFGFRWRNSFTDSTRAAMAFALLNWLFFCVTLFASLFISRRATADGTTSHSHSHSTTYDPNNPSATTGHTGGRGGFKFSSLGTMFTRRNQGTTDVEKGGPAVGHNNGGTGPVNETGQPVELNDRAGHANGVDQGYGHGHSGGYGDPTAGQPQQYPNYPPPAANQPEGRY